MLLEDGGVLPPSPHWSFGLSKHGVLYFKHPPYLLLSLSTQYADEAWQRSFGRVLSDVIGKDAHSLWLPDSFMPVSRLLRGSMVNVCGYHGTIG